jgi:hypothetical protein
MMGRQTADHAQLFYSFSKSGFPQSMPDAIRFVPVSCIERIMTSKVAPGSTAALAGACCRFRGKPF